MRREPWPPPRDSVIDSVLEALALASVHTGTKVLLYYFDRFVFVLCRFATVLEELATLSVATGCNWLADTGGTLHCCIMHAPHAFLTESVWARSMQ
jgi:hypothetical protein